MTVPRNTRVDAYFERHLLPLAGEPLVALQIGVYMGDTTLWLLDNVLTSPHAGLDDVDPWIEGYDGWTPEGVEREYRERIAGRVEPYSKLATHKMTSREFLAKTKWEYDFIYIDGDHRAAPVLEDAIGAWRVLKKGGLLAFDDYTWGTGLPDTQRPLFAIEAFLAVYADQLEVRDVGEQVWVKKL